MKEKLFILFLVWGITGCVGSSEKTAGGVSVEKKSSIIRVGMSFKQADSLLKSHGAKPTAFQLGRPPEFEREGQQGHFYALPSGTVVALESKPEKSGRVVCSISVSTYELKSWQSKDDPEASKFFRSFKDKEEYNIEKMPNQTSDGI